MAVPFSKPAYPGGAPRRRRPQQQQQQEQQQQQQEHPITRFLHGQGGIQLDQLSLTSRIAFYALYEAWRLLQDLTNTNTPTGQVRHEPPRPRQNVSAAPVQSNNMPDVIPRSEVVSTQQQQVTSQEKPPRGYYCTTTTTNQNSPAKPPMTSPIETNLNCQRGQEVPNNHYYEYPDLIPTNDNSNCSKYYPDLLERNHNTSSSSSLNVSSLYQDSDEEDEFDCRKEENDSCADKTGVDWQRLGNQLCEIASAFEVSYAPALNDHQKQVYEIYRRLRLYTLSRRNQDNTVVGLAKNICRQVLLSSIWILLKKVI